MVYGFILALIEVSIIFGGTYALRHNSTLIQQIKLVPYYWLIFTIITGFLWETSFVINYKNTTNYSAYLIEHNQSVWTNQYNLTYLAPNKFSYIFYGTYGAWADREYMNIHSDWSRVIESTHAIFCALFALLAILLKIRDQNNREFLICLGISMGSQLMNSILYMVEYFIQCTDPNNVNYNDDEFPMGTLLSKRPFMWVNIFWTIMPLYTILVYIIWMPPAYSQGQCRPNQRQYHTFNKNQHNESPPKYAYSHLNSQQSINEVELEFEDTKTNLLKEA